MSFWVDNIKLTYHDHHTFLKYRPTSFCVKHVDVFVQTLTCNTACLTNSINTQPLMKFVKNMSNWNDT